MTDRDNRAGAFALNALTPEEREDFWRTASEQERQEALALQKTAARLGQSMREEQPSADLKERLMVQIQGVPQEKPEIWSVPVKSQLSLSSKRASECQTKGRHRFGLSQIISLGATAVAVAALAWGVAQQHQLHQAHQQISALQASASSQSLIDQISRASDMSFAQGSLGKSKVSVVYSPSHGMASVSADSLPTLPTGKSYMIWFYDAKGQIVGSGTLESEKANSLTELTTDQLATVTDFGITVEEDDTTSPSEKPMMLEQL